MTAPSQTPMPSELNQDDVEFYKSFDANNNHVLERSEAIELFKAILNEEYSETDCNDLLKAAFPKLSPQNVSEEMLTDSILADNVIPAGAARDLVLFRELLASPEAQSVFATMELVSIEDIRPYSRSSAIALSCVANNHLPSH